MLFRSAVKVTPRRTSWVPPGTAKDWPTVSKMRGTAALDTPADVALLSVIVTSIVPGVSTGGGDAAIGCCDVVEPGLSVALDGLLYSPYGLCHAAINPMAAYEFL